MTTHVSDAAAMRPCSQLPLAAIISGVSFNHSAWAKVQVRVLSQYTVEKSFVDHCVQHIRYHIVQGFVQTVVAETLFMCFTVH